MHRNIVDFCSNWPSRTIKGSFIAHLPLLTLLFDLQWEKIEIPYNSAEFLFHVTGHISGYHLVHSNNIT